MIELFLYLLIAFIGFYLLSKSADMFVEDASYIGEYYGMNKAVIGLTIVALGTSLPELFTSFMALLTSPEHYPDYMIGTIIGSNISNILLIIGIFLIYAGTFRINKDLTVSVMCMLFFTAVLIGFIFAGGITIYAAVLLLFYMLYLVYMKLTEHSGSEEADDIKHSNLTIEKAYGFFIVSMIGLFISSRMIIFSIDAMSSMLNIGVAFLSLTLISVATSLPEFAVTISAARKGEYLMSIGNILGSNIANIGFVIGVSAIFGGYSVALGPYIYSIIFLVIATLLFSYLIVKKKFYRIYGYIFILLYVFYLATFFIA